MTSIHRTPVQAWLLAASIAFLISICLPGLASAEVQLMDVSGKVNSAAPAGVSVGDVALEGADRISIKGTATSESLVAKFMRNLERSGGFRGSNVMLNPAEGGGVAFTISTEPVP